MDSESERTRQLGCWDGPTIVSSFVNQWTTTQPTPDFEPDDVYCNALIGVGFNECSAEVSDYWRSVIKSNYRGDDGRRRIRMAAINLAERGGLHLRLSDIRCPVLWLHVRDILLAQGNKANMLGQGTKDAVYSAANATEEIKKFTQSPDAQVVTVSEGAHFLNWTHPADVNKAVLDFIEKCQS